jgi:hypothetical protein
MQAHTASMATPLAATSATTPMSTTLHTSPPRAIILGPPITTTSVCTLTRSASLPRPATSPIYKSRVLERHASSCVQDSRIGYRWHVNLQPAANLSCNPYRKPNPQFVPWR